jgi:hypothetical protein
MGSFLIPGSTPDRRRWFQDRQDTQTAAYTNWARRCASGPTLRRRGRAYIEQVADTIVTVRTLMLPLGFSVFCDVDVEEVVVPVAPDEVVVVVEAVLLASGAAVPVTWTVFPTYSLSVTSGGAFVSRSTFAPALVSEAAVAPVVPEVPAVAEEVAAGLPALSSALAFARMNEPGSSPAFTQPV